eukprot:1192901-Prorocentrum_minimum.AAC.1
MYTRNTSHTEYLHALECLQHRPGFNAKVFVIVCTRPSQQQRALVPPDSLPPSSSVTFLLCKFVLAAGKPALTALSSHSIFTHADGVLGQLACERRFVGCHLPGVRNAAGHLSLDASHLSDVTHQPQGFQSRIVGAIESRVLGIVRMPTKKYS